MRLIKMFGVAAIAAVSAMAFVGAGSATAATTGLCSNDSGACVAPAGIHFEATGATLLTTTPKLTIKCNALIQGGTPVLGNPASLAVAAGALVYSSCNNGCKATEEVGGTILGLREGTELASVKGDGFRVRLQCGEVVDCKYTASGLVGHGEGALLSGTNGRVSFNEAEVSKEGGGVCPATAKLTATFVSLAPLYIRE